VDEDRGSVDSQDAGDSGGADDDDNDDGGGVDFGMSVVDDVSQSQFMSQPMDGELMNGEEGSVLMGDNLLAVPRKVCQPLTVVRMSACRI